MQAAFAQKFKTYYPKCPKAECPVCEKPTTTTTTTTTEPPLPPQEILKASSVRFTCRPLMRDGDLHVDLVGEIMNET